MIAFLKALFSSHKIGSFWLTIILGISYILQVVISALIILCFCCNKEFRKKPGSIILFYAISALGVSIIGGLEHYGSVGEGFCESLGFLALFFEYNCLYYEIGFIAFFICDFEEFLKNKFATAIQKAQTRQNSRQASLQNSFIEAPVMDLEQLENRSPEAKAAVEQIGARLGGLEVRDDKLTDLQSRIDKKKNDIELLIEKIKKWKFNVSRSRLQKKINFIVIILSLASCLVSALSDNLGPNMFGGCSEKFDPTKVQELSMGFYLFLAAGNAVFSALGLISFFQQRKRIERKILKPLDRDFTEKEKKKIHHYIFEVRLFIAVTTFCCWIFSGLNIYAAITVMNNPDSHWNYEWSEIKWDLLLILHLAQGLAVLLFKLTEPMVWNAIKATLGNFWEGLTGCCKKRKESLLKEEDRRDTGLSGSQLKIGVNPSVDSETDGAAESSCGH